MIRKLILLAISIAVSASLFGFLILQWSGLGLGNNVDWVQQSLLTITLLSLVGSIIFSLFGRTFFVLGSLGTAVICLAMSINWASSALDRKAAANEQRQTERREASLRNAVSTLNCPHGDRFVLQKGQQESSGKAFRYASIELIPADSTLPLETVAFTTGQKPPDPDRYTAYSEAKNLSGCQGDHHPDLHAMFNVVVGHYRAERAGYYPADPLYEEPGTKTELGAQPVDPFELLSRIQAANKRSRIASGSWDSYRYSIKRHVFDDSGKLIKIDDETVEGGSREVIWEKVGFNFKRGEAIENDIIKGYLETGTTQRKNLFDHVLYAPMIGEIYVIGHQAQGLFAWEEPVLHAGREAYRYAFHSSEELTFGEQQRVFEFIVDRATGLVLLTAVTKNGVKETRIERLIEGEASSDFPARFRAHRDFALAAQAGQSQ